jgi:DNA repair exonuclease SbcCD ATPase subunit
MKINNFFNKRKPKKLASSKIVLNNEHEESKLKEEVTSAKKALTEYKEINKINEQLTNRNNSLEEANKDYVEENEKFRAETITLKAELEKAHLTNAKIPELEEKLNETTGQLNTARGKERDLTLSQIKLISEKSALGTQATDFEKENKTLKEDNKLLKNNHDSMKNDYDLMEKDLSEHKSFTRKVSILYKEGVKKLDSFAQQKNFWESKAVERENQLEEAKRLEKELRTWVSDLEISEGDKKSKFKNSSKKVTVLQNIIKNMETNINGLTEELEFTTKLLKELKIKASKASYMSESMIARTEGFKLPFAHEAEPRKYLGNSKQTLFKFKSKETAK